MNREKLKESIIRFFESNKYSGLLIGFVSAVIIIIFSFSSAYELFELKLYDLRFTLKPSISQWDRLYFINIDDPSTAALGQFPWTREIYANPLNVMREVGLSLIAFDVMFFNPSPKQLNEELYAELMRKAGSNGRIKAEEIAGLQKNNDNIFADSVRNNGTAVLSFSFSEDDPMEDEQKLRKTQEFKNAKKRFERIASIPVPEGREKEFRKLSDHAVKAISYPIVGLLNAAKNFGFVNRYTDIDGTIRRVRLVQVFDGRIYFNLALTMIIEACGVAKENIEINPGKNIILKNAYNDILNKYEDLEIPIDKDGIIYVNWAGEGPMEKSFHYLPFYALVEYPQFVNGVYDFFDNAGGFEGIQKRAQLTEKIDKLQKKWDTSKSEDDRKNIRKELLENIKELKTLKIGYMNLLVNETKRLQDEAGQSPTEEQKRSINVLNEDIKTVELVLKTEDIKDRIGIIGLTATGTSDIASIPLHNEYPGVGTYHNTINTIMQKEFINKPGKIFDIFIFIIVASVSGFFIQKLTSRRSLAASIAGFVLLNLLIFYLFAYQNIWFEQLGVNLALLIPSTVIISIKLINEETQKKFIKGAFSRYIAPDVIDQIMLHPDSLKLGGEERRITIFFSDVKGFSTISENLSAPDLVKLLNEYLSEMTDIIISHGGTIDKYEGDAIMAFYGAPQPFIDHELRACLAAIDMKRRLRELQERWRDIGQHQLSVRMGMNTGLAVVGNMGSKMRMDYTAMGDSVNLASRLEGANKWYNTTAMISENTYKNVKNDVETRRLDTIRVIGKTEPIIIYELIGLKGTLPQKVYDTIEVYDQGLELFSERQWKRAHKKFNEALSILPDDGPSQTYITRCEEFMKKPPSAKWDGVYSLKSK